MISKDATPAKSLVPRWQRRFRRFRSRPLYVVLLTDDAAPPPPKNAVQRQLQAVDDAYQQFFQKNIDPLLGSKRHELMAELDLDGQTYEAVTSEKGANRRIGLSLVVLGGTLVAPTVPIIIPVIVLPAMAYFMRYWAAESLRDWRENQKLGYPVIVLLSYVFTIYTGKFFVSSLANLFVFLILKAVANTKNEGNKRLIEGFNRLPKQVWVLQKGNEYQIDLTELRESDVLIIRAGEVVDADGIIVEGSATIDQHMLTGESQPVEKNIGDVVMAGTLIISGVIHAQVQETGDATVTAQIVDALNNTAAYHTTTETRAELLVDQTAPYLIGGTLLTALVINPVTAVGVTWLPIAWPVVFTAPLSTINFLNIAADHNILIKDGRSLELLSKVDTVVFDKTGTLTLERPQIGQVYTADGYHQNDILMWAACAEYRQSHPIARAIIEAAESQALDVPIPDHTDYASGMGLRVEYDGQQIWIGGERFMQLNDLTIPDSETIQQAAASQGVSLVYVALNDAVVGVIELLPTYRPEVQTIVDDLHQRGIEVVVISGDHEAPTRKLAERFGIDRYYAQTLPEDKAKLVRMLQEDEGRSVCFVGDGINDGIALKTAHVSISIQGSTNVALDAAQVILMDRTLNELPYLLDISHRFNRNMNTMMTLATVPGTLMVGGMVVFGWSLGAIAVLSSGVLASMVGTAFAPAVREWYHNATQQNPQLLSMPDETV